MICVRCVVCLCLSVRLVVQSQIQDFPKGEAPFVCQVDAIQWGGVVAKCCRGLRKPARFSGGGGAVADFFRGLRKPARLFSGRSSSRIFPWSPKADAPRISGGGVVPGIFR